MPVPVLPSEPMFIKDAIEKMTCPIHGQHPKVEFDGDEMIYSACCDEFLAHIKEAMPNIRSESLSKSIHHTIELGRIYAENKKI